MEVFSISITSLPGGQVRAQQIMYPGSDDCTCDRAQDGELSHFFLQDPVVCSQFFAVTFGSRKIFIPHLCLEGASPASRRCSRYRRFGLHAQVASRSNAVPADTFWPSSTFVCITMSWNLNPLPPHAARARAPAVPPRAPVILGAKKTRKKAQAGQSGVVSGRAPGVAPGLSCPDRGVSINLHSVRMRDLKITMASSPAGSHAQLGL